MTRPWPPTHPGVMLRDDVLPGLIFNLADAVAEFGVEPHALDRVLNGLDRMTPEMAEAICRVLSCSPRLLLDMQAARDEWVRVVDVVDTETGEVVYTYREGS